MAQLDLYVAGDLAARLKREARRKGMPLSRYVLSLLSSPRETDWPPAYLKTVCGFLRENLVEPEDRLPEPGRPA